MRDGMRHYVSPDELDVLRRFVEEWEDLCDADHTILASLVARFREAVATQSTDKIRNIRLHAVMNLANDDLGVDDNAEILEVDSGFWVQSWTWVPKE